MQERYAEQGPQQERPRQAPQYATAQQPNPAGALGAIYMELEGSLKQFHDVLQRTRALCDRVVGSQPEPVGDNKVGAVGGSCSMSKLEQVCGYLNVTASDLSAHLARLERL